MKRWPTVLNTRLAYLNHQQLVSNHQSSCPNCGVHNLERNLYALVTHMVSLLKRTLNTTRFGMSLKPSGYWEHHPTGITQTMQCRRYSWADMCCETAMTRRNGDENKHTVRACICTRGLVDPNFRSMQLKDVSLFDLYSDPPWTKI